MTSKKGDFGHKLRDAQREDNAVTHRETAT